MFNPLFCSQKKNLRTKLGEIFLWWYFLVKNHDFSYYDKDELMLGNISLKSYKSNNA